MGLPGRAESFRKSGVLWITGGLLFPDAGLVRGLARSLRAEFQINRFVTLAIDNWSMPGDELVDVMRRVLEQSFSAECASAEYDREFALKGGGVLLIPRLVHDSFTNQDLATETREGSNYLQTFYQKDRSLRLTITSPGLSRHPILCRR